MFTIVVNTLFTKNYAEGSSADTFALMLIEKNRSKPSKVRAPPPSMSKVQRILLNELERRARKNPKYSLRAFALSLGISAPALSMMISGQRRITQSMAKKLAPKLGLQPSEAQKFIRMCKDKTKAANTYELDAFESRDLSLETVEIISEWYHFAILSLIDTVDFKPDLNWISNRLGITHAEVKAAVDRLVRLEILDIEGQRWRQIGPPILVENEVSTSATRKNQTQVLEKAILSLEQDPMNVRDTSSMTFAIDPAQMPLAIEEIRKFRVYLMNLLEGKQNAREVYHLAVQFYPVSKSRK